MKSTDETNHNRSVNDIMKIILIIALLGIASIATAQVEEEWVAVYNGANRSDNARDIATDGRGNIYVTGEGYFESDTLRRGIITARYNSAGEEIWLRGLDLDTSTSGAGEYGYRIAVDSSGNVYVAGDIVARPAAGTTMRMFVIKYDADGKLEWSRVQPNRSGADTKLGETTAIAVDAGGNIIVAGQGASPTNGFDYLIYKYRPNGDLAWQKSHNGPAAMIDRLHALAIDDTGNIYVTGTIALSENNLDPMTIKYDTAGTVVWKKQFINPKIEVMKSVQVDGVGNVYVNGYTAGTGNDTTTRVFTIKYNAVGDTLWTQRWRGAKVAGGGLPYQNGSYDMKIDRSGNVYVIANQGSINPTPLTLIKYSTDGQLEWAKDHQSTSGYIPQEIVSDGEGSIYMAAIRSSTWRVVKFDTDGELAWDESYKPSSFTTVNIRCWGIALDQLNNVYVCGAAAFQGQSDNFVTIKYAQGAAGVSRSPESTGNSSLTQNHPNPVNAITTIGFSIPNARHVKLTIHDMLGREVATVVDQFMVAGTYSADFDATGMIPGGYFYRLAGDASAITKLMLVR